MKTERRHELQKNELADWLGDKLLVMQKYSSAIAASALAVAVLIAVGVYLSNRSASQTARAWQEYFMATGGENTDRLQELATRLDTAPAGKWARLRLADQQLQQGTTELFQDPAGAHKLLADARGNYHWLTQNAHDKLLEAQATLGLAKTFESEDKLPEAREQYERLAKEFSDTVYAREARNRLSDLDKQSTRQFYDWFAQREAKASASKEPGIPGLKPKFDSSNLPGSEGDIKFEHAPTGEQPAADGGPSIMPQAKKPDVPAIPDRIVPAPEKSKK